jgi:hypothetical protein
MNPQICACLEKLVRIRHPKCLLCFPHRLPLNGRPPTQNRWISHFPEDPNMLWSRVWGRLWRNKGIVHSPKLDKICNIPSHPQCYSRLTLPSANSIHLFRERVTANGCLQRRKAERPGDEIGCQLVLPSHEVLDSWRVVLQGARQKPIIHWIPACMTVDSGCNRITWEYQLLEQCKGGRRGAYAVVVGASTAAAVAMCVQGESGERRRGAEWVARRGQEEESARGTREGGRARRRHSFGRSEATEAAGFGIGEPDRRRRRREEPGFGSAFWGFLGVGAVASC